MKVLLGRLTFCIGIGLDQLTPEFKTISFWEERQIDTVKSENVRFVKPKMINVKPQPFSVQIKDKRKKR